MRKQIIVGFGVLAIFIGGFILYSKTGTRTEESPEGNIAQTVIPSMKKEESTASSQIISASPSSTVSIQTQKGPYPMEIDTKKTYQAILTTSFGDIIIELTASKTPVTVNNFVSLSRKNFYNNTVFHRIIKGFMIQGGDPKGNGTGGPGYKFDDEPFEGEYTRGTVAMANAGPNTNGSQFFIMHKDYALPKNYVIFGKVTSGMDVVDTIAESPTKSGGEGSTPVSPTTITSVTIIEK